MMSRIACLFLAILVVFATTSAGAEQTGSAADLARQLQPFLQVLAESEQPYAMTAKVTIGEGDRAESVSIDVERIDAESFRFEAKHKRYWVQLQRRRQQTALVLPLHKVAYVGTGAVSGSATLKPDGITNRLFGPGSNATFFLPVVTSGESNTVATLLIGLLNLKYDQATKEWAGKGKLRLSSNDADRSLTIQTGNVRVHIQRRDPKLSKDSPINLGESRTVAIDRKELERHLVRGVRRGLEVLAPSPLLTSPIQRNRKVPHGELRWIDGQRVVLLQGTPEQIGRAHGQLLKAEALRCMDSVLHMFGTAQTINTGRWFKHDLEEAYKQLQAHIPDDHKAETAALAKAVGVDTQLAQTLNVFPELFHCSGFAVFGKATSDGKLYHGRVLDYMTTIGLQDAATTFVVAVDGKIPFVNVGYAAFIGSVSGMNAQKISLGEMGGRGEGKWNGVPMATLMRRALEECQTLDDVMNLWENSPRTCEYYYVFADGKTKRAVGVAATPESIEFVHPGQADHRLGDGIEDAVVLSSGSRLETLRARVIENHGKIDLNIAKYLMSRPVAMKSNLHNVLFIPEDGVLFVANADHKRPAAERSYMRLDLNELLGSMARQTSADAGE